MKSLFYLYLLIVSFTLEAVTLTPIQDADVYQFTGGVTGTYFSLNISPDDTGHALRSLLEFEVTSASVGFGSDEVEQAVLELYVLEPMGAYESFIAGTLNVYYQTATWAEASVRWNDVSLGDLVSTFEVSAYSTATQAVIVQVDLTDAVKAWLDGNEDNNGIVIQTPTPTTGASTAFASREAGVDVNAIVPHLIITKQAAIDSDNDGYSDADEIAWGSDPNDPAAVPLTLEIEGLQLRFNTWAARTYRIEYSDDLDEWHTLIAVINGDGDWQTLDVSSREADWEFYRLVDSTTEE